MKIWLFFVCLGFSVNTMAEKAQSSGSEQQHQAAAGAYEATAMGLYQNLKINGANGATSAAAASSAQITQFNVGAQGEYGITDAISTGLRLFYDSSWTAFSPASASNPNTHGTGMANPELFVNGRIDLDASSLRLGTTLGISLADKYFDNNGNRNFYTGGTWFQPFVGYEYYYGEHTFGGRLQYRFNVTTASITVQQSSGSNLSANVTGGDVFDMFLFYEYDMNLMKLGLDIHPQFESSTTFSGSNTVTSQAAGTTTYFFDAYAPMKLSDSFTVIPQISYIWLAVFDTTSMSSANGWAAQVKARFAF